MNDRKRVHFPLTQDEDGYPPATVETLWASDKGEGLYEIDNIPFFVRKISVGDVVRAQLEEGALWFQEREFVSAHSTVRIVVYRKDQIEEIRKRLERDGCSTEFIENYKLIAVDVPPSAAYEVALEYLKELAAAEIADYEESALRH
jgi:hypothetical protein